MCWFAALFELKLGISAAIESQRGQERGLDILKPSRMNRLQRSLVSGRVPAVAKDSTVHVSHFLVDILKTMSVYLHNRIEAQEHWKVSIFKPGYSTAIFH